MQKKILIIGATWEQEPLFIQAQEMGLDIIATNPTPNAKGFLYSTEHYFADPRDLNYLEEIFLKTKPDAVIADECDYSMFAVAYLSDKYGLNGPGIDSLIITTNKYLQRKIAEECGVRQPKYRLCFTLSEVIAACNDIGFPVMIKPVDNRGSIGICKIERNEEIRGAFFNAISNSYSHQVIVEQYIDGKVVSVEGIFLDVFSNLSYSTKKMHPKYSNNAMHLQFPGNLESKTVQYLYSINKKLIKCIGLKFGLTHSEYIINENGIYFIEIANRGGGVHISNKILPAITGMNTSKILINAALGRIDSSIYTDNHEKYAILHFFDYGPGKIKNISGIEQAKHIDGVLALRFNIQIGDYIQDISNAIKRPGFVIVTGDSLEDCLSKIELIEKEIIVELFTDT